jgi:hypothetical protein
MCLQFGFVIFWWKDLGAKAAHKMLVKLIPDDWKTAIWGKEATTVADNTLVGSILTRNNLKTCQL